MEETNKGHVSLATRSDMSLPIAEQFARFLFRKRHFIKETIYSSVKFGSEVYNTLFYIIKMILQW